MVIKKGRKYIAFFVTLASLCFSYMVLCPHLILNKANRGEGVKEGEEEEKE